MSNDWYLEDEFWRTFGSLMFNEQTFAEAEAQVEALLELAGQPPAAILDLGCGPGRHALPLAAQGYPVTAVDTSPTLLAELESRRGDRPIEIVEADMRSFERPGDFDLALVMWTSFGYFEDEADHRRVLERIRASLSENGRLVLDLVGLEHLCRTLEPVHLTEYDDGRILIERPLLVDGMRRLENEWLLVDGDRVVRTTFSHRVWSASEITSLLNRCGLTINAIHGGYEGEDYGLDSERMIVVAEKN